MLYAKRSVKVSLQSLESRRNGLMRGYLFLPKDVTAPLHLRYPQVADFRTFCRVALRNAACGGGFV